MHILINGKCDDKCFIDLRHKDGRGTTEYSGYVPHGFSIGGGDYIKLRIDNDTGKIIDWVPLRVEEAERILTKEQGED